MLAAMSRAWTRCFVVGVTAASIHCLLPGPAAAETKLSDLNGTWRGAGRDRNAPWESLQSTKCRTTIRADSRRMNTEMVCENGEGQRKVVHLSVTLDGDQLTGKVSQQLRRSKRSVSVLNGSVSGQRTDTSANLKVRWSDLTPNTTLALKLNGASSYSMKVTALGLTMMDVTFSRSAVH
jgi:hypothetical protein